MIVECKFRSEHTHQSQCKVSSVLYIEDRVAQHEGMD